VARGDAGGGGFFADRMAPPLPFVGAAALGILVALVALLGPSQAARRLAGARAVDRGHVRSGERGRRAHDRGDVAPPPDVPRDSAPAP
jgi:hypothetical protein